MFLTFFLDLVAIILYFFQKQDLVTTRLILGLSGQVLIVLVSLIVVFSYKGKKYSNIQPVFGVRYFSFRFAFIVFSFIGNSLLLFLYVLNYLGINSLIFLG